MKGGNDFKSCEKNRASLVASLVYILFTSLKCRDKFDLGYRSMLGLIKWF